VPPPACSGRTPAPPGGSRARRSPSISGTAARRGHALIDRELYLPKSWTSDPARCAAAGIPADVTSATKPQLARRMIERAVAAKVPFAWVAGDEVYGDNGPPRTWLEQQHIAYVLAVAGDHRVPAGAGRTVAPMSWPPGCPGGPGSSCQQATAPRAAGITTGPGSPSATPPPAAGYLLIRRNQRTGELAFYRCCTPQPATLAALVKVAGLRWTIEENFQASKGLTGLDEHQVRRWTSWYRWVTLAMLAAAVPTITAALKSLRTPAPAGHIPLTRNEIARLFTGLTIKHPHDDRHQIRWSNWRRSHQHRAKTCHYQRQATQDP
jgi:SRSO17 transposase